MTKAGDSFRLPSLAGWRALSIALGLLLHSSYASGFPSKLDRVINGFDSGSLGVRFFFVISGFLITCLLLQEQTKHGTISLKKFYVRRALRILPVYFFYLFALGFLTRYSQTPAAWLANLTFTTNFFPTPFSTTHFWSLGVEEQFYLLWPWFLVVGLNRREGSSKLLKILIVPLFAAPVIRIFSHELWYPEALGCLFQRTSFFGSFDSLAYGCLTAILFVHWRKPLENFYENNSCLITWGGATLILAPPLLRFLHIPALFQAAGFDSMQAMGFSLLLLQSIFYPQSGFYRCLNWKWVAHIGILSYSIYIWQELFCAPGKSVLGVQGAWYISFPGCILAALLAAHASYYLLEKPLLGLRARFREA